MIPMQCSKRSPKTWEAGATILTATVKGNKKASHPRKLKISGCKIDFCSVPYRIPSNHHSVLPQKDGGRQIFEVMERPVKLGFKCWASP